MSTTIDSKVVEMRFDNKDFEKNVHTSMTSLQNLKSGLNMNGVTDAFAGVEVRFSHLQATIQHVINNITDSVLGFGKKIATELAITPIKTGFTEYETQINAIQTILANTQKEGTNVEQVNDALDILNTYADKTIYNFTEMTRNIGKFTAAGVKLDTSVTAIQGISNLAAVSGASSQQASTAMYQLSQALASGTVRLMDWNSVVNASMGGQVLQDALKETARVHGIAIDELIADEGSFRDSLSKGWLSADILTETLEKFTLDVSSMTEAEKKENEERLRSIGYNDEQIEGIFKLGQMSTEAATKVKTFTQLVDTLKEAAQSGWSVTWRTLIGDFDEAKALFTEISDVLGGLISKSADSRNKLLQGWKELGGRQDILEGFKNIVTSIGNVLARIAIAFRNVFPPKTAEDLKKVSSGFKSLTEHLKISDGVLNVIQTTLEIFFKGLKLVLTGVSVGIKVIKTVLSWIIQLGKSLFELIYSSGWLRNEIQKVSTLITSIISKFKGTSEASQDMAASVSSAAEKSSKLATVMETIRNVASKVISKLREIKDAISSKLETANWEAFGATMSCIWGTVKSITGKIWEVIKAFSIKAAQAFNKFWESLMVPIQNGNFDEAIKIFSSALFGGLLFQIIKIFKEFREGIKGINGILDGAANTVNSVVGILDSVKDTFEAYQKQLKSEILMKIAKAIALLVGSIAVLTLLDQEKIKTACHAIGALMATLAGAYIAISRLGDSGSSIGKTGGKLTANIDTTSGILLSLSLSMLILSAAISKMGVVDPISIGAAIGLIVALVCAVQSLSKMTEEDVKIVKKAAKAMKAIAASLAIVSIAVYVIGNMGLVKAAIGVGAVVVLLGALTASLRVLGSKSVTSDNLISAGFAMLEIAAAMCLLSAALKVLGTIKPLDLVHGLAAITIVLGEFIVVLKILSKNATGAVVSAAAILIMSAAISILTPALLALSLLSFTGIAASLGVLAGAFIIMGVAGLVLKKVSVVILLLAASLALIGASVLLAGTGMVEAGAGLMLLSIGLAAFATSASINAKIIVSALTTLISGLINMIPAVAKALGDGFIEFCKAIGNGADALKEAISNIIVAIVSAVIEAIPRIVSSLLDTVFVILDMLIENVPTIVTKVYTLIFNTYITLLNTIAANLPAFVAAIVNLIMTLFKSVIDALSTVDTKILIDGIKGVGVLAGIMAALAAVASLTPLAMLGVVGMGAVVAELALVFAAVGQLATIPGLVEAVEGGGAFISVVGYAIGSFIGAIVGGFGAGMSSGLPAIGENLSAFMNKVGIFVEGAKAIDARVLDGIKNLVGAFVLLTAGEVMDAILGKIIGEGSLTKFAESIEAFGPAIINFYESIKTLDEEKLNKIKIASEAGSILAKMASEMPNEGGVMGWFFGENSLGKIAEGLAPFGEGLADYYDYVKDLNPDIIKASAEAATCIAKMASEMPNEGGVVGWFFGENSLGTVAKGLEPFGEGLAKYYGYVKDLNPDIIKTSSEAATCIAKMASKMPNQGGVVGWFVGENSLEKIAKGLGPFGEAIKDYYNSLDGANMYRLSCATGIAKTVAETVASLPKQTSDLKAWFSDKGSLSLSTIGKVLAPFGSSLVTFGNAVVGIKSKSIGDAMTAFNKVLLVVSRLPERNDSFNSWISGDPNDSPLTDFASELYSFGKKYALLTYSFASANNDSVINALDGVKALMSMANDLPNRNDESNFNSWFSGDWQNSPIIKFAQEMNSFGGNYKVACGAFKGASNDSVISAFKGVKSLIKIANDLPNRDNEDYKSWFSGNPDNNFSDSPIIRFAKEMNAFGAVYNTISWNLRGANNTAVEDSLLGISGIIDLAANLPERNDHFKSWFNTEDDDNSQLWFFAKKMASVVKELIALSNLSGYNGANMNSICTALSTITTFANNLPNRIDNNFEAWMTGDATLIDFGSQLSKFGVSLSYFVRTMAGVNMTLLSASTSELKKIVNIATGLTTADISKFETFGKSLGLLGSTGITKFIEAFQNGEANMISRISKTLDSIVASIKLKFGTGDSLMTFNKVASNIMLTFSNAIVEHKDSENGPVKKFVSIVSECVKEIRGKYEDFKTAGKYLVAGLSKGISENTPLSDTAVKKLGNSVIKSLHTSLEEASPSKASYRAGKFLVLGFVNSVTDYTKDAESATALMGDTALNSFIVAISTISDYIDENLDSDPVIRPVLDLSNVESKTARLNSMVSSSRAITVSSLRERAPRLDDAKNQNGFPAASYSFVQNNYSPRELSRTEIYRQTKNQFSAFERMAKT